MKKPGLSKAATRCLLMSAVLVMVLSAATAFWGVRAADGNDAQNVSLSDVPAAVSSADTPAGQPEEAPGEEPVSDEARTVTVQRRTPNLLKPRFVMWAQPNAYGYLPSASFNGNYRSELNLNEKKIYDGFYNTYVVNESNDAFTVTFDPPLEFDASHCYKAENPDDDYIADEDIALFDDYVLSASGAFFYDCPEAFWIRSFNYRMDFTLTGAPSNLGYFTSLTITTFSSYPGAYGDLAAVKSGLAAAVEQVRANRVSDNRYYTAKAIHDYVCGVCDYDYDAAGSNDFYSHGYAFTATPAFTGRGRFVCEGYSKAVKLLCNEFNIPCVLVSGMGMTSSTYGGPHMWNYIQMEDGQWYGVDSTWDDNTIPANYTYFMIGRQTVVAGSRTFGQNHLPDGQIMSDNTTYELVYPTLSENAYNHYIEDTAPELILRTLGASIRISEPYGIRFGIQIVRNEALNHVYVPEFGTLIISSNVLGDAELNLQTPMVRRIRASQIYSVDDSQVTYTGVLTNIPQSFFDTKVKGRGYMIYVDDQGLEHVIYSETVEKTFNGVARAAYESYSAIPNPTAAQRDTLNKLKAILGLS